MPNPLVRALMQREQADSEDTDRSLSPEEHMNLAALHMDGTMPTEMSRTSVKPMGLLDRLMAPTGAQAVTNPFTKNVRYNPDLMPRTQAETDDLLAHELTHVKQMNQEPLLTRLLRMAMPPKESYQDRPTEIEAYGVEKQRQAKRQDIVLPKGK
jgi:uncharacterized protein DUF4157